MPMIKNNGNTVFGVRMGLPGLSETSAQKLHEWDNILPGLQSLLPKSGVWRFVS